MFFSLPCKDLATRKHVVTTGGKRERERLRERERESERKIKEEARGQVQYVHENVCMPCCVRLNECEGRYVESRCQFHQRSTNSFYACRSQKSRKVSQVVSLYCAFRICECKSCAQNVDEIDTRTIKVERQIVRERIVCVCVCVCACVCVCVCVYVCMYVCERERERIKKHRYILTLSQVFFSSHLLFPIINSSNNKAQTKSGTVFWWALQEFFRSQYIIGNPRISLFLYIFSFSW